MNDAEFLTSSEVNALDAAPAINLSSNIKRADPNAHLSEIFEVDNPEKEIMDL